uniref:Uncharacterized protein n=1 Tax=Anguilla anguilla TaxID=7936 RepID=A0A0E9WGP5_ANGAN
MGEDFCYLFVHGFNSLSLSLSHSLSYDNKHHGDILYITFLF